MPPAGFGPKAFAQLRWRVTRCTTLIPSNKLEPLAAIFGTCTVDFCHQMCTSMPISCGFGTVATWYDAGQHGMHMQNSVLVFTHRTQYSGSQPYHANHLLYRLKRTRKTPRMTQKHALWAMPRGGWAWHRGVVGTAG